MSDGGQAQDEAETEGSKIRTQAGPLREAVRLFSHSGEEVLKKSRAGWLSQVFLQPPPAL